MSSSEIKRDLIIDVGLHKGEDTEYYLRKGFRVAAIEADPALARAARTRFSKEIKIGRLHIFEGAIADRKRHYSILPKRGFSVGIHF